MMNKAAQPLALLAFETSVRRYWRYAADHLDYQDSR